MSVKPKKHLGQHFLTDTNIALQIVELLSLHGDYKNVLEIGPGMGVLTNFLIQNTTYQTWLIDIDRESIAYLNKHFPTLKGRIIEGDFLRFDVNKEVGKGEPVAIIGNFPYNISSQIFFSILEMRQYIPEVVCMLQKEVAERLASPPGNRDYGILSVFLQAYYDIEYCFTVQEHVFDPPPRVKSGVIRLKRNARQQLDCDEKLFVQVVKQGFNNRRKTLRNALKPLGLPESFNTEPLLDRRAEQLSVADFMGLTNRIQAAKG
ncbi:16S rRNA (adenine1518-N6/adenine1519-N6)-dimethyltransferase [Flexibacter flexilis DSM 6793]|uniref:Ribosomal RNA small subunit methyltransferase A n=1 Tax=Flexibacter flexilis DSM 6793 TaxID=927664 RepID=A0A1I1N171_9BACT|nr:16S rRNA (adenine(1518)-N(6)/adenine(1519)-N(6))-dimethyltransferase RsmA [Flexibacter flexilis]SFC89228.1 16S rRNA (adenine1518-N6/adenine1519-N6)-dimethyltransferase [Flexibacter flexilis DSM 6793]